jgi:hypothetical protein
MTIHPRIIIAVVHEQSRRRRKLTEDGAPYNF